MTGRGAAASTKTQAVLLLPRPYGDRNRFRSGHVSFGDRRGIDNEVVSARHEVASREGTVGVRIGVHARADDNAHIRQWTLDRIVRVRAVIHVGDLPDKAAHPQDSEVLKVFAERNHRNGSFLSVDHSQVRGHSRQVDPEAMRSWRNVFEMKVSQGVR